MGQVDICVLEQLSTGLRGPTDILGVYPTLNRRSSYASERRRAPSSVEDTVQRGYFYADVCKIRQVSCRFVRFLPRNVQRQGS